ncbi:MAG TPA: hypothetical protein PKX00_09900, partial [Opitutaceae bacterium]|nr:hypothetical protein [Opitutaceae bacterium]
MNKLAFPLPGHAVLRWWGVFVAVILSVPMRAGVVPGPAAAPAVELSAYRVVLHVDLSRGDDIKGDGSRQRPFAGLVAAIEAAGRPDA